MACSSPLSNPAAARLLPDFPSHTPSRAINSLRYLVKGPRRSYIPLHCNQHRPVPALRSHLPINSQCYTLQSVVAVAKTHSLLHPHLLRIAERPPPDPPSGKSYEAWKLFLKGHLFQDWSLQSPPPLAYRYPPTLIPHPFIELDWFTAARIHQMCSGKSPLAVHSNWDEIDPTKTYPSCLQDDQLLAYAILACSAKA